MSSWLLIRELTVGDFQAGDRNLGNRGIQKVFKGLQLNEELTVDRKGEKVH